MITYYNRKPTGRSSKADLRSINLTDAMIGDINWGVDSADPKGLASAEEYIFTDIFDPPQFVLLIEYRKYSSKERKKMRAAIIEAHVLKPQSSNESGDGYRLLRTRRSPHRHITPGSGYSGWLFE